MNELEMLIKSIEGLLDIDDEDITDEMVQTIKDNLNESFSPTLVSQAVNQIVNNLEQQGLDKKEAKTSLDMLSATLKEMIYKNEEVSEKKKAIVEAVTDKIDNIFNNAAEKYHSYAIELPMTVDESAKVPTYAHVTDAAADLYAMETVVLEGNTLGNKIRTGVKILLPEGWLALIIPRSSIGAKTPLRLSNSVGLIDSGYRGELGVLYDNISDTPYAINAGDRIAQLLVMPSYRFKANVVESLEDSDRGEGGFGSSGV